MSILWFRCSVVRLLSKWELIGFNLKFILELNACMNSTCPLWFWSIKDTVVSYIVDIVAKIVLYVVLMCGVHFGSSNDHLHLHIYNYHTEVNRQRKIQTTTHKKTNGSNFVLLFLSKIPSGFLFFLTTAYVALSAFTAPTSMEMRKTNKKRETS